MHREPSKLRMEFKASNKLWERLTSQVLNPCNTEYYSRYFVSGVLANLVLHSIESLNETSSEIYTLGTHVIAPPKASC